MTKPLKYKVWDITKQVMLSFEDIFNTHPWTETSTFSQYESYPKKHEVIVREWTGLLDKNGTEIYADDIVMKVEQDGSGETDTFRQVMWGHFIESVNRTEYTNRCYGWYVGKEDEFEDYEQIHNPTYWLVAGNIYENPDLLELLPES